MKFKVISYNISDYTGNTDQYCLKIKMTELDQALEEGWMVKEVIPVIKQDAASNTNLTFILTIAG